MDPLPGPIASQAPPASALLRSASMQELLEILASQVHRTLVRQHPEAMWKVRAQPVPYDQLPESCKAYEREAAMETLRDILGQGWHIEPPPAPDADLASYRQRGEDLLKQGESLLAYDTLTLGLRAHPGDPALRQLQCLALIRSGAPRKAHDLLHTLMQEGFRDQGTLAPLARCHKDLSEQSPDPRVRRLHLERACELYTEAYGKHHGIWSGINAATLGLLLGRQEEAEALAADVELRGRQLQVQLAQEGKDPFWVAPVLGQAALIRKHLEEALELYALAAELGRGRIGDLAEIRHNALSLMHHLGLDHSGLDELLPVPRVVVFAGHMMDHLDRATPRFTPDMEAPVSKAIADRLAQLGAGAGFATAACGSALLFHEAMLARGGEVHIVLPYGREEFIRDSVAIRPDQDWTSRFEAVLAKAKRLITASPQRLDSGNVPFQYANLMLMGLAQIRTQQLYAELVPMVVWDGQRSAAPGSTAWTLDRWREMGLQVEIIRLEEAGGAPITNGGSRQAAKLPAGLEARIMVLLFADVVSFSSLEETQIPLFVAHFLEAIRRLEQALPHPPRMKNTWGDGLFMAFEGPAEAAVFAQGLVDTMARTSWAELGLPAGLNLRVALHAGPVYVGVDPVTGKETCFGTHVNRAARMEPITPPGQVYASQAYAAVAAAEEVPGMVCEFVGQLPLAKGFGTFPMYLLRVLD
ncbi:MAG TPA: tetratricopeptide repeat-containing protein [Holophagaceae bacterium]|nr:tetratricopeptide repeat-containing protein [Holophagaceae bacterium]